MGIRIIKAYSPQAKGRVERSHRVYQDRLVKELKLRNITTIEEANKLLSDGFINNLNEKFAKPASETEDGHIQLEPGIDLDQIFCWEVIRSIRNDWTFQFKQQHYQIDKATANRLRLKPKQKVTVRTHLDDSLSFWYGEHQLICAHLKERPKQEKQVAAKPEFSNADRSRLSRLNKHKSPWSKW